MIAAVLAVSVALAVLLPIASAFAGKRLLLSIVVACLPALAVGIATVVSLFTAWGGRIADSSDSASNSRALFVAAVLALMGGVIGVCLAALITRVRRGNAWTGGA